MDTEIRITYDKPASVAYWDTVEPHILEIAKELSSFGEFYHSGAKVYFFRRYGEEGIRGELLKSSVVVDAVTLSRFILEVDRTEALIQQTRAADK